MKYIEILLITINFIKFVILKNIEKTFFNNYLFYKIKDNINPILKNIYIILVIDSLIGLICGSIIIYLL